MASTACIGLGLSSASSHETMTITVRNRSCLERSWPPTSVGVILLLVAGSMLSYPIWALLLAKYVQERDSLVGGSDSETLVTNILDALARGVLETAPMYVARAFTLYIGLCVGYVGLERLGLTLRCERKSQRS
jgi:hypothetical protein